MADWVFQANPQRYNLLAEANKGRDDSWAANQRHTDIRPGDRVWFRVSGATAGLYVLGKILSPARHQPNQFGDWRLDVQYEYFIDPPILRAEIDAHPVLQGVRALTGAQGTNFRIPPTVAEELETLVEGRLREVGPAKPANDRVHDDLRGWLVIQAPESKYKDVEGTAYHYPLTIPNAKEIRIGDILICYRPAKASADARRIFGIGRVAALIPDGDNEVSAVYDRYASLEPRLAFADIGGDPRPNTQHSISPAPSSAIQTLLNSVGAQSAGQLPLVAAPLPAPEFSVALALDGVLRRRLFIASDVIAACVAALAAGKHLLLIGSPGTGKTSLAEALAEAAERATLSNGWRLTTATADWTSTETVGGYWMTSEQRLEFRPGIVLQAIDDRHWLVIDELNRADIDKAFGQLFTVLSGQSVVLPYREEVNGKVLAPAIVPEGAQHPTNTAAHTVPRSWRIIATLNTRDRDLLFNMSYALLRRFAIVEVDVPDDDTYVEILRSKGQTGSISLDERLAALIDLPHRALGPAILLDCAAYLQMRLRMTGQAPLAADDHLLMREALASYVIPQLDDLSRSELRDIVKYVQQHVFQTGDGQAAARLFSKLLRVPIEDIGEDDARDNDQ